MISPSLSLSVSLCLSLSLSLSYVMTPAFTMGGVQAMMFKKEKSDIFMMFKAFDPYVWVTFHGIYLFYSLILTFASFLGRRIPTSPRTSFSTSSFPSSSPSLTTKEEFTFRQSLWYFSLATIQLGADRHPVSKAGKMLQQLWSFFLLITMSMMTANMAAIFSAGSYYKPLETLAEISGREKEFRFGAESWFERELPPHQNPDILPLIKQKRFDYYPLNESGPHHVEALLKDRDYVWIGVDTVLNRLMDGMKDKKRPYKLEGYITFVGLGFAMRHDWPYAEKAKELMLDYSRSGLTDRLARFHRLRRGGGERREEEGKEVTPMSFRSFVGVFAVVIGGGIMALLLAVFEYFRQMQQVRQSWKITCIEPQ